MKAATYGTSTCHIVNDISIHAAREGGDTLRLRIRQSFAISIHAAREGGDHRLRQDRKSGTISIHAAREGGDVRQVCKDYIAVEFQSTPPVKAATEHNTF